MNNTPLISVIVLCYNQEKTIARTLDSILNQKTTYRFEIIIGEDASPSDNTRVVCENYVKKYPSIIRLLAKEPNKGVLLNYSDCVSQSRGKYIATCAGDDWWHNPEKLEMQVNFLEANDDYGVVYTNYSQINIDSGEFIKNVNSAKEQMFPPSGNIYRSLIIGNQITACTVVFKKEIFIECVDLKSFWSLGFLMEDYPMWLEMVQYTKFKYLSDCTSTYTIAGGSLSIHKEFREIEDFELNCFMIRKHYLSKYPIDSIDVEYLLDNTYKIIIYKAIVKGFYEEARVYVEKLSKRSIKNKILNVICNTSAIILFSLYLKHQKYR